MTPSNGKFRISKYSNSRLSVISKDERFKIPKPVTPGPNVYENIDNFSSESKYILSHRKGTGRRPFDCEKRFTVGFWKSDSNPAPVAYDKPSDFGVYGDLQYYKSLSLVD
jgi:hypothetical protein